MLEYVPVRFDLYRPLKPCLRWTLQCLVAFADRTGKCWPSVRKLAEVAGISKSSVSRHLTDLARAGIITRLRRPGIVCHYHIDPQFLPASAKVSHSAQRTVPPAQTEEKPIKKTSDHNDSLKWEARLRGWQKRRMWLNWWGPKPNEAGCWAPGVRGGHQAI